MVWSQHWYFHPEFAKLYVFLKICLRRFSMSACENIFASIGNFCLWSHSFRAQLCSICGGGYPCFEISAVNADKPPLSVSEIKNRVKQFEKVGKLSGYLKLLLSSRDNFTDNVPVHVLINDGLWTCCLVLETILPLKYLLMC